MKNNSELNDQNKAKKKKKSSKGIREWTDYYNYICPLHKKDGIGENDCTPYCFEEKASSEINLP